MDFFRFKFHGKLNVTFAGPWEKPAVRMNFFVSVKTILVEISRPSQNLLSNLAFMQRFFHWKQTCKRVPPIPAFPLCLCLLLRTFDIWLTAGVPRIDITDNYSGACSRFLVNIHFINGIATCLTFNMLLSLYTAPRSLSAPAFKCVWFTFKRFHRSNWKYSWRYSPRR